jgi:N-acyl homoserine lactone hydrolase
MMIRPGAVMGFTMMPMTVAVLTHENGDVVLVDAGFSSAELAAPAQHLGPFHGRALDVHGGVGNSVREQLEQMGIAAESVKIIVATHLHLDHVGGFVDFPNAEVVAPAAEYVSAGSRGSMAGYVHVDKLRDSGQARAVTLNSEARHGFPGHLDLFRDGRVLLLDAKGHTAGSVAVMLTDPETQRTALMAGDAAYHPSEYRRGKISLLARITAFRKDWLQATWGRLADFESVHPDLPIVLSHDAAGFPHLPHC